MTGDGLGAAPGHRTDGWPWFGPTWGVGAGPSREPTCWTVGFARGVDVEAEVEDAWKWKRKPGPKQKRGFEAGARLSREGSCLDLSWLVLTCPVSGVR